MGPMKKRRSHSEIARMGGKARIAKLDAKERSALARKAGLANADRIAKLRAELDGFRASAAAKEAK